ncbi:hypothetical protein [Mesomycoplasma ovipneumoniae]
MCEELNCKIEDVIKLFKMEEKQLWDMKI